MAYISSFVFCDSVQPTPTPQGIQTQVMNPLSSFRPVALPGNFSFAILCILGGLDTTKDIMFKVEFIAPDGEIAGHVAEFPIALSQQTPLADGKKPEEIQVNLDVRNMVLSQEGTYAARVYLDEGLLGEYKITAKVKEEGE